MAKGVTSAYLPLGVVAISPEIAASFDDKVFYGGLTYSGHPLCLAAGIQNTLSSAWSSEHLISYWYTYFETFVSVCHFGGVGRRESG